MAPWDATTGWVTLEVRARSQEEAREIATGQIEACKLEDSVDLAIVPEDRPRELDPEGPSGIVVEDLSQPRALRPRRSGSGGSNPGRAPSSGRWAAAPIT